MPLYACANQYVEKMSSVGCRINPTGVRYLFSFSMYTVKHLLHSSGKLNSMNKYLGQLQHCNLFDHFLVL